MWKEIWGSNTVDKVDFKTKTVIRDKEGQYTIIKDTVIRRYNNCKYLCAQNESTQIHKAVNNKHKGTNWYEYSASRGHPIYSSG